VPIFEKQISKHFDGISDGTFNFFELFFKLWQMEPTDLFGRLFCRNSADGKLYSIGTCSRTRFISTTPFSRLFHRKIIFFDGRSNFFVRKFRRKNQIFWYLL